jgi:glycosyltransferase involved in cell wall biosynthesis
VPSIDDQDGSPLVRRAMSAPLHEDPLVSVVIPTYDRLPLLRQAIDSVRAQTYPRWELLVADDGSRDGTAGYVASLADPRIRLLSLPHTGHLGRVRNAGIRAGTGAYVALLDSDDVWLPGKLEAQVRSLRESPARWSYTGYEAMDAEGRPVPLRSGTAEARPGWLVREILESRLGAATSTLVVERAFLHELGGFAEDPRLAMRGDYELVLRLAYHSQAAAVPGVLVRLREHAGRTTSHVADPWECTARTYDAFLAWCRDPGLRRIARRRRGLHRAQSAALRLGEGAYLAAARLFARALAQGASPATCAREAARAVRARIGRARTGGTRDG